MCVKFLSGNKDSCLGDLVNLIKLEIDMHK